MTAYKEIIQSVLRMAAALGDIYLINIAQCDLLHAFVLQNFSNNTTISTSNDQNILGVGMGCHGEVSDHLLISVEMENKGGLAELY